MTLIEVMVAAGVLVITSVGGYSGFLLLNRQAANMRNISMARALCQERIEQALTLAFRPSGTTPVLPAAPSAVPYASPAPSPTPCTILGTTSNYTSGTFNGTNVQTSTETIPVFTQSESTSTSNAAVTYTRTTTVSPGGLFALAADGTNSSTSLNSVLFTVQVTWSFRSNNYSTSMSSLRAPD